MMTKKAIHVRLYVAGEAPNSLRAVANLRALCRRHFPDQHDIEIVDVLAHPARALDERIFITPQLIFVRPRAGYSIIGDLSDAGLLARALGVEGDTAA